MQKIIIGKVIKPVGIKGEVKVIPLTDNPERFKLLKEISIIEENDKIIVFEIEKVSIAKNAVNLKLKGINTREQAEEFKNKEIGIDENEKFPLQDGYYYIYQILGLKAYDEEGNFLGKVSDILKNPGNDIFIINKNNKDYLIPAVKEFIKKIDLNNGNITIKQIDGLFD